MPNPIVSVLFPARNAGKFLSESLDSILSQYLSDFEIILVTQESNDNTKEIADRYASIDRRIKHIEDENTGVGSALNIALSAATGEFLLRQDADDVSLPNRFLAQVNFMNRFPNIDVLGTGMKTIGREKLTWRMPKENDDIVVQFLTRSSLLHPTICIRGSFAKENKIRYSESPFEAEDFALWVELINKASFANLDFATVQYRIHSNQVTQKHPEKIWESTLTVRRRLLESLVPQINESEFQLHDKITRHDTDIELEVLSEWFQKILDSNRLTKIFDERALLLFLNNEKNSFLARAETQGGATSLNSNLTAKLVRTVPVPIRQKIKALID